MEHSLDLVAKSHGEAISRGESDRCPVVEVQSRCPVTKQFTDADQSRIGNGRGGCAST